MSEYYQTQTSLITKNLKRKIEAIIHRIESQYRCNQGLILTEADLKCLLFQQLQELFSRNKELHQWRCPTLDNGVYASPLHAEAPWYDENNKLAIRPDITILQPQYLSIMRGLIGPKLPSKQFEFSGQGIIFEIKFCRYKSGISRSFLSSIQKDFNKTNRLREQRANNNLYCYYVVFNKTDNRCPEFNSFLNENREGPNHKLEYCTGLVNFQNKK